MTKTVMAKEMDVNRTSHSGLAAGDYTVTEVSPLPEGWSNTEPGGPPYEKVATVTCGKKTTVYFGNNKQ